LHVSLFLFGMIRNKLLQPAYNLYREELSIKRNKHEKCMRGKAEEEKKKQRPMSLQFISSICSQKQALRLHSEAQEHT